MFHITGIFPLCILLTPSADKMLWSFQRGSFPFGALTVTERLSALTLTRGLFTELPLSTARYSAQQKAHPSQQENAAGRAQSCWLSDDRMFPSCIKKKPQNILIRLFSLGVSSRLLNENLYKLLLHKEAFLLIVPTFSQRILFCQVLFCFNS